MDSLNTTTLPLALAKRASVLDGLVLLEVFPIERIKALLKSDLLLLAWDWDNYSNEKEQLIAYMKNYNINLGAVSVKYGKPKHKWGRSFPYKSLGLSTIRREVRNALIKGLYYDCDLKNAQPEIIRNLCESNKIPCPIITRYCSERSSVLLEIQNYYEVNRDTAKDLFIRLCFFGSFVGWCLENKIQEKPPLEFITLFERELNDIVNKIKVVNPTLYETARKKKEVEGENKERKVLGSFFALYNQEYESRIVESVLCYLINHTDLMKVTGTTTPAGTYEYDGIKLLKKNVDSYEGGIDAVLELLNRKTFELTGFTLEWSAKSLDDAYDLEKWIEEVKKDDVPLAELIADMNKITSTIEDADAGICELLMKLLPNNFIYSVDKTDGDKGDWYGWNKVRWERGEAPLRMAIIYDVAEYWHSIMDKWDAIYLNQEVSDYPDIWVKTRKVMYETIRDLKKANGISSVVAVAKTLMANYSLEFDTKEDLFGCENGVIDIAEECFRPYRFDDYITWSCGYNFTPNLIHGFKIYGTEEVLEEGNKVVKTTCRQVSEGDLTANDVASYKDLNQIYENIFPDNDLRNYFFKIISTGMSGRAIEKFFIFNGAGRNGKGLTNEFLKIVLGNYYESVSPTLFNEDQKKKTSSGANPELAKLDKKRYVVAKEPQKDQPLHNSVIKDITGGGNTSGRMLYSSKTNVKLSMTLIMECNDKPPFSEAPKDADILRINDIAFISKFTETESDWDKTTGLTNYVYPVNPLFKDVAWQKANANSMLNIMLQHLLLVKSKNYVVDSFKPESVRLRSLAYLQNSYDIHNIFTALFEKHDEKRKDLYLNSKGDEDDKDWSLLKIVSAIRKSSDFSELPKKKQKEYDVNAVTEFLQKNNFYKPYMYIDSHRKCQVMRDWRLKPILVEEEE